GASPERAEEVAAKLRADFGRRGLAARTGVACFPRDRTTPEALLAFACAAVRGASPAAVDGAMLAAAGPGMRAVLELAARVGGATLAVLIVGETGAGKEVLAERLPELSRRARGPLVKLHCAALSPALLESELFGHERGAFTGADAAKPGHLEAADGGTVF